ncbi:MAG: SspB family protein [Paracoccaceae bacterium]
MAGTSEINYGRIMERAMRSVLADVLGLVAEDGLPGEHYFYITFDTRHPGVDIDDTLRRQYPEQMTIVLQHEFSDLAVTPDRFTVTLSFSGRAQVLVVPFAAVHTFADPSANFGLKFDDQDSSEADEPDDEPGDTPPAEPDRPAPEGGADVVSLDRFRKP